MAIRSLFADPELLRQWPDADVIAAYHATTGEQGDPARLADGDLLYGRYVITRRGKRTVGAVSLDRS